MTDGDIAVGEAAIAIAVLGAAVAIVVFIALSLLGSGDAVRRAEAVVPSYFACYIVRRNVHGERVSILTRSPEDCRHLCRAPDLLDARPRECRATPAPGTRVVR